VFETILKTFSYQAFLYANTPPISTGTGTGRSIAEVMVNLITNRENTRVDGLSVDKESARQDGHIRWGFGVGNMGSWSNY
jgi:hypothetical protein